MIFGFATANAQKHIKRVTPWHWSGFNTIEEKATVGELSSKTGKNKVVSLDLEDYTPVMSALHRILTQSTLYSTQRKKPLPPFTYEYLKEGLRRSWTAEQIGHLLLKYESEWYADEALSKWNEIDELFEEEKQQQKDIIEKLLTEHNITKPNEREYAFEKLDEAHENVKSNWQIEKEQRIKPSLWWKKVAEAQVTNNNQTTNANTPNNSNTPKLTNLSSNGKVWFIHPVAMVGYFPVKIKLWHEPLENPQRTYFSSNKLEYYWNGAFGMVRTYSNGAKKAHTGLDLFARIGTPCFACLDGEIVQYKSEGGYGNVLVIKVKGDDLRASRNEYTLEFSEKGEIEQSDNFDINRVYFYLRYCHLSNKRTDLNIGDEVKSGDLIGYTGDTGNAKGVCNPHLHLEIAMNATSNTIKDGTPNGKLAFKINPAFFVNLQPIDQDLQKKVKARRLKKEE